MEAKFRLLLIRFAHLSEKLKLLSEEIDELYELIGDEDFVRLFTTKRGE
jgi:hypothetical protein